MNATPTANPMSTGKIIVYPAFSEEIPSDITLEQIEEQVSTASDVCHSAPRKSHVEIAGEGWESGAETGGSTLSGEINAVPIGEPTPLIVTAILYCIFVAIRNRRRDRNNIPVLLLISMSLLWNTSLSATNSVRFTLSAAREGDSVAVTPEVSHELSKAYLCWSLYYDAACTNRVPHMTFSRKGSSPNSVAFMPPSQGTYYVKAALHLVNLCAAEDAASYVRAVHIYPSDADIVLVREHQDGGERINLASPMPEKKKVYGALHICPDTINDSSKSRFRRYNYYISLPFDVQVGEVSGLGTYGTNWVIRYYDGLSRAQNGYWSDSESFWRWIDDTDSILHANQGYLLSLNTTTTWDEEITALFPAYSKVSAITVHNETIPALSDDYRCTIDLSASYGAEADRTVKDSYWRCIGLPSLVAYESSEFGWNTSSLPFLYEWNSSDNSLSVISSADFTFQPMHAYLVQNGNAIIWQSVTAPASIAAKHPKASGYTLGLRLKREGKTTDRTYIRFSDQEDVSADFDFGQDLSKERNPNADAIYTLIGSERAAGNSLPISDNTTFVPVGVTIASEGQYTFSMPEGTHGINVILVDSETGTHTHLTSSEYTITLPAGTIENRFMLEISGSTVTAYELPVTEEEVKGERIIENGILYIRYGEQVYSAQGQRIQ